MFRRSLFQKLVVLIVLLSVNSVNIIILGLPFFKSEPHHYFCKGHDGKWSTCSKQYICTNQLTKNEYRPDTTDEYYIENWTEQVNLICESKSRIGFLGASYFIGVIFATAIIPIGYLSDLYGRKWVFVFTNFSEIIACNGFIQATSLDQLYIYMFILGMGHPGRVIVAINYGYEFITEKQMEYLMPML